MLIYPRNQRGTGIPFDKRGLIGWWAMDEEDNPRGQAFCRDLSGSRFGGLGMELIINAVGGFPIRTQGIIRNRGQVGQAWSTGNSGESNLYVLARQWPQTAMTIAGWIFPTTATTQSIWCAYGAPNAYLQTFIINPGQWFCRLQQVFDAGYIQRTSATNVILANEWQHLAMVWDGGITDAAIQGYVNGRRVDTTNGGAGSFFGPYSGSVLRLEFGTQANGTVPYTGNFDDVRMWSRALSAGEILNLATEPYRPTIDFETIALAGIAAAAVNTGKGRFITAF